MIDALPALADVKLHDRWRLLAALGRGRRPKTISPERQAELDDERENDLKVKARLRAKHLHPHEYAAAVGEWKRMKRDAIFLRRLVALYLRQQHEAEITAVIEDAVRRNADAPRHLCLKLGLPLRNVNYRLRLAKRDLERAARGLPTQRELVEAERRAHWASLRAAVERGREPRKRGRPRKKAT